MPSASDRRLFRVLLVLAVCVLTQLAVPVFAQAQQVTLSDTDRGLLVMVRQAGLWEMPASDMAYQRGSTQYFRDMGKTLMVDHGRLDVQTRALAKKFAVPLPDAPNPDQQVWLDEIRNASSQAEFERVLVNRLRLAHGLVFNAIAQTRVSTTHAEIRAFADTANQVVLRHITLLEGTGLVDYGKLPQPAAGTANLLSLSASDVYTGIGIALGLTGAGLVAMRLTRRRRTRQKYHPGDDNARTLRSRKAAESETPV
ncbi:DUF4142 domain-containing protein [Amycolatopsis alkalitolerans]|uniref:DUF4142 domain-containing protein n=1 Tax=Amycolatopsis alkalitolerans TaxID=2547244 RepID=A0A5C4M3M7_9PSEU|nr:DUF4142 domain-containing protein [Amycolatopsis alkalitolerans]TNC27673.1 DUF4142 domain-containing protein [Amycolatopsis alkalitolerans]